MTDPNSITAHFDEVSIPATITALEGGGGYMRVTLNWQNTAFSPAPGMESELEMHDGGRFRVTLLEQITDTGKTSAEFRMKLLGRGRG
ncbi:hypothetical protein [Deinococcus peraridilitoris]|uniref:hypothetical protein n=1 Tax=Deinococcus peraridilitoris TaxID=432329 RepID=UPI0012FC7568|nr:hypothetical protein [Deinococcus peraridilitoris]